jgi:hypothetical protein
MKPTTIMTRAKWIKDTSSMWARGRSTGAGSLEAVDNALLMFEACTNNQWPEALRAVESALADWIAAKTKDGKLKTVRSHDTIRLLESQIAAALSGKDPEVWSGTYPPILVSQDVIMEKVEVPATWKGRVDATLGDLNADRRGKELIESLSAACEKNHQRVVIAYGKNQCAPVKIDVLLDNDQRLRPKVSEWMSNPNIVQVGIDKSGAKPKFIGGPGCSALVLFDPDIGAGPDGDRPAWVALGHELIHAYHYVTGTCARPLTGSTNADSGLSEEEMQTIGTAGYDGQIPSENWLRESAGAVKRTKYSGYDFGSTRCTLTG